MSKAEIILSNVNGQPRAFSTDIAAHFGKRHDNVLRRISALDIPENFRALNFEETTETVAMPQQKGSRKSKVYSVTRDGFTLLVMGFTGKKAMKWKVKYIQAFNEMEKALMDGKHGEPVQLPASTKADRKPLIALVSTWVSVAPVSHKDAWIQIHAAMGSDKAENMTMEQVEQALRFVQARIDMASNKVTSQPVPTKRRPWNRPKYNPRYYEGLSMDLHAAWQTVAHAVGEVKERARLLNSGPARSANSFDLVRMAVDQRMAQHKGNIENALRDFAHDIEIMSRLHRLYDEIERHGF